MADLMAGEIVAGGSTITQQTAKVLYLSNERTLTRKIKELWYTILPKGNTAKTRSWPCTAIPYTLGRELPA